MKTTLFLLICFMTVFTAKAIVVDLTGTWTMCEMTYDTDQGIEKMTEDQMRANGSITDLFFMEEGKFKQTSNMSGSGSLDTYEGTWKIDGNKLLISLHVNGQNMVVDYTYEMKNDLLLLTRTSPDGKMKIICNYKKK